MEAVGFTAAALSLAKATKATYKLTKRLYRAARDAGKLSSQIEDTTVPFATFASALKAALASLDHYCIDDDKLESSLVMKYFEETAFPANLQQQSRSINTHITALYDRIDSITVSGRLPILSDVVKSFKWTNMKPDIEALLAPMESIKTTLSLTINVFILEKVSRKNKDSPTIEQDKEIAFLKTVIGEQIETIRVLQEDHHCTAIPRPVSTHPAGAFTNVFAVGPDIVVCHLAQSMATWGTVPESPPETFSFRRTNHRRRSHKSSNGSETQRRSPRREGSSTLTSSSSRHSRVSRNESTSSSAGSKPSSLEEDHETEHPAGNTSERNVIEAEEQEHLPRPQPPAPASETRTTKAIASRSIPGLQASPRSRPLPSSSLQNFNDTIIKGTLRLGGVPVVPAVAVEAYINARLKCNLITRSLANRLGLDIVERPVVSGYYNGSMIRKEGTTTLRWNSTDVECAVCDELPRSLIFGREFVINRLL